MFGIANGGGPGWQSTIRRALREAGFSVDTACRGFHAITTHILGFTLQKLDFPIAQQDLVQ